MSKRKAQDPESTAPEEQEAVTEESPEVTEEAAVANTNDSAGPAPDANAKRGGNGAITWLALLVSLAALAAVAYVIFDDWQSAGTLDDGSATIAALGDRIDESQNSLSSLDSNVATLSESNAALTTKLESQQRAIDERIRTLESLPTRMTGVENSVSSLQGVSAGTRDTWLLSEAEYYMQIANVQLQLAGNPHLATLALRMADERIVTLANPGLIDVRAAISDELAALDVMAKPDIEGVTLTLSSLARVVDSLPLRGHDDAATADAAAADSDEQSGFDRAIASVKETMAGLIKITAPDQASAPLVTPDAIYFLRTNLTLQLQVARLALLRGETAVFEQSLDDASDWLQKYFDTDSAQVASSLETIAEIRGGQFAVTPPDISKSLRLLRQFRSLTEPKQ